MIKMGNCEHDWVIDGWVTPDRPSERHCKKCNKRQKVTYQGGDMWKWVDK